MALNIFEGNLNNETHKINFIRLLNEYIEDKMGGGEVFKGKKINDLLSDLLNFPTFMVIFAMVNNDFVGMSVCFYGYSTFSAQRLINIHDIFVSGKYRNMGIGKTILEFIIDKGKKLKCCKITLEVRTDNKNAKHLYKSLGFKDSKPPMLFWNKRLQ